jgi:hypothetical protein
VQSDDQTYPYFLQQDLNVMLPGRNVEVVNAGYHGQNIDDLLEIFRQKVLPIKPDIVIFYEAANNIDWSEFLTDTPQNCWEDCWLQQYPKWYGFIWKRSALFELISERLGSNQRVPPPLTHTFDESLPKRSLTHYNQVLSQLVREATDHDVKVILSSFVTLANKGLTISAEDNPYLFREMYRRMYPLTPDEVGRVYDRFNQESAAVARRSSVAFADVSSEFPKDPRYFTFDYIHLSPEGNSMLAKLLAAHLLTFFPLRIETGSGITQFSQGAGISGRPGLYESSVDWPSHPTFSYIVSRNWCCTRHRHKTYLSVDSPTKGGEHLWSLPRCLHMLQDLHEAG